MEKYDLQQIISGTGETEHTNIIQAIAGYLRKGQKAGGTTKAEGQSKQEEENRLKQFIDEQQLWWKFTIENSFIAEGAEHKVFLCQMVKMSSN